MSSIGERMKQIRLEAGLSQAAFAERVDVSKGAISSYENGLQMPGSSIIANICDVFDVEPSWLLLGKGEVYYSRKYTAGLATHAMEMEDSDAKVAQLEADLERLKQELLAAQIERDRAKEEAYKAMKLALKAHGSDLDSK